MAVATTTFPNGQVLTSTAITVDAMNSIMQPLLTGCLGILPDDPLAQSAVRIAWQTTGAPAFVIGQDILSLRCVEEDNDYDKVRDMAMQNANDTQMQISYEYTRVWRISLRFRGPNSFDRARLVRTALLLDWVHDTLAPNNLFVVPQLSAPVRGPELYVGQWWEVVDFSFLVYEQVNETIEINQVASVEVILNNNSGVVKDITVTE